MKKMMIFLAIFAMLGLSACNSGALKELQADYDEAIEENDQLEQDIVDLEDELSEQEEDNQDLQKEIDTYKDEIKQYGDTLKTRDTDIAALQQAVADMEGIAALYESPALDESRAALAGVMNNLSLCEYWPEEDLKVLQVSVIVRTEADAEGSVLLGETVALMSQETWFDYDYIYIDVITETGERISSVCLNPYDYTVHLAEYTVQ